MLLCTLVYKFLCEDPFSILLDIRVQLLGPLLGLKSMFHFLGGTVKLSHEQCMILIYPLPCQHLLFAVVVLVVFVVSHSSCVKWPNF